MSAKLPDGEVNKRKRERERKYYAEHREEIRKSNNIATKKYYEAHKEEIRKRNNILSKKYYQEHLEEKKIYNNAYTKQYNKTHKEERRVYHKKYNIGTYGLTSEEYEKILQQQEGKCAICKEIMDKPCIDHCHQTGKIRGILCVSCNHGLGNFRDSIDSLLTAAEYLGSVFVPNWQIT